MPPPWSLAADRLARRRGVVHFAPRARIESLLEPIARRARRRVPRDRVSPAVVGRRPGRRWGRCGRRNRHRLCAGIRAAAHAGTCPHAILPTPWSLAADRLARRRAVMHFAPGPRIESLLEPIA